MSQTEWDRRVLLILGREDELEPKDALDEEQSEYLKAILGMSDQGLLSRSSVMRMMYGVTAMDLESAANSLEQMAKTADVASAGMADLGAAAAAFSDVLPNFQQVIPEGVKLRPLEPKMGNSDADEEIINKAFIEPYSPKDAEMAVRNFYKEAIENTDLEELANATLEKLANNPFEGLMVKPRRPLENIDVKVSVDFEKMERRILGIPEEDDEE